MQKHIQHNKDEQTQFFRKIYISLYLKGFERVTKGFTLWEVSWRLNRTATYWPQLFWLQQHFFPVLLGFSTGVLGAQPLLGHGCHFSIFSPTDLNFLSPGLYNNLTSTNFLRASHLYSIQPVDSQGYPLILWYLRPDAPVIYTGAFLILTAWPGSICNILRKTCHLFLHLLLLETTKAVTVTRISLSQESNKRLKLLLKWNFYFLLSD